MADGVHLLVERALDHLDEPEMAAILTTKPSLLTHQAVNNPDGSVLAIGVFASLCPPDSWKH
jgi:hypothetical protein